MTSTDAVVVDSSAIVAAVAEPDGAPYLAAVHAAAACSVSAVSLYETRLVLTGRANGRSRFRAEALADMVELLRLTGTRIVPFDSDQAVLAHQAYLRYGRGFHKARLNFADCASYALAKLRGEPLLFKGDDFALTDIERAL